MTTDITRNTFRSEKRYTAVVKQQGRLDLDTDFNEQGDIGRDDLRRAAASVIGATGFPEDNPGLGIVRTQSGGFLLTPGEAWVDGIRVEIPPAPTLTLSRLSGTGAATRWQIVKGARAAVGDQILPLTQPLVPGAVAQAARVAELLPDVGGRPVIRCEALSGFSTIDVRLYRSLESQPFLAGVQLPPPGQYAVYLDVWEREVTALEDPAIREVALGGPDTAARMQLVFTIGFAKYSQLLEARTMPASCSSFGPGWTPFGVNTPRGAMAARAEAASAASDPCVLPSTGGYRHRENRLYRVEIHNGGDAGTGAVQMKWSLRNAISAANYLIDGNALVVDSVGRDQETVLSVGDFVEITNDARQLAGRPGFFAQISDVNENRLALGQIFDADTLQPLPATGSPNMAVLPVTGKVTRWEGGLPKAVVQNSWMKLEHGVEIRFAPGYYDHQNFWQIPARSITADIEWSRDPVTGEPASVPPMGVAHHYCALGLMNSGPAGWEFTDCRSLFAPLTRQRGFHYLGGDGQEAMPDPLNPGLRITLGSPLRAGCVRGRTPVVGAQVRFRIIAGTGLFNNGTNMQIALTNPRGIAAVNWSVDAINHRQEVIAELLDSAGNPTHLPIFYTAYLGTAAQTSFDPTNVPELAGANTVQEAIEKLAEMQCGCTICVSAEAHNSGELTIQAAIAKLPVAGGTVCLGPGDFILGASPVIIMDRESIRLRGHGIASQLAYSGAGGAIRLEAALDVRISDLAILVASAGPAAPAVGRASAVQIANSNRIGVTRTRLEVQSDIESADLGVALDGFLVDVSIEDNEINAPVAIGALADQDEPGGGLRLCLLYELRIADNLLSARRSGVALDGYVLHMGAVHILENAIRSQGTGISATGASLKAGDETGGESIVQSSGASLWIRDNMISFRDDGIVSGIHDLRVLDNHIGAMTPDSSLTGGSCIRLAEGIYPAWKPDGQIVGNSLGRADRFALAIETPQASLIVKNNLIRNCAAGAVAATAAARIESLSFDNNAIEQVGTRRVGEIVAGVSLAVVDNAQIVGNSLRGVGQGSSGAIYWVGFAIAGAPSLELSNNVIADIGPEGPANAAVGVLVEGAILNCSITANSIIDGRGPTQMQMSWCGIFVGGGLRSALFGGTHPWGVDINMATAAMFADPDNLAMRIDATGATPAAATAPAPVPVREPQINISLNKISDAHAASRLPLVRVASDTNLSSCIFTGNQCTLRGAGSVTSIVDLRASRLIVANNVVRRLSDATAITLNCRIVSQKPDATILGNITFGKILVNNQPIPAPFVPLNLLSA